MTQHNKVRVKARKIWLTALATSTLIALTACTPTTDANPTQPTTTTTTTTSTTIDEPTQNEASTTPLTPPAYPEGIDEFTEANAIKFVEFYIELINYATQTGDTALLAEYSAADCAFCREWIDGVEERNREAGSTKGFEITLSSEPTLVDSSQNEMLLSLEIHQTAYELIGGQEAVTKRFESEDFQNAIVLEHANGIWRTGKYGSLK